MRINSSRLLCDKTPVTLIHIYSRLSVYTCQGEIKAPLPIAPNLHLIKFKNFIQIIALIIINMYNDKLQNIEFTDLLSLETIQQLQDSFARATGVASIITKPDGTPITKPSNFCRLCSIIRNTEKGLKNCYTDAALNRTHKGNLVYQKCLSAGLWDCGARITIDDKHLANWMIGQIKNEDLDEKSILEYAREIGADETEYRAALAEVTTMPLEKFKDISTSLHILANQLSEQAYQNLHLKQNQKHLDMLVKEKTEDLEKVNKQLKSANEDLLILTEKQKETEKELRSSKEYIEKELNKSQTMFQAFMDNIPVNTYIKDPQLNLIFVNQNSKNMLDVPNENPSMEDIFPKDTTHMLEEIDREVLATGKSREFEFEIQETGLWLRGIKFPIKVPEGETYLGGIAFDITKQIKTEQERRKSEEKYTRLFEDLPLAAFRTTPQGTILEINNQGASLFGYDSREEMKKSITNLAAETYAAPLDRTKIIDELKTSSIITKRHRFKRKDGTLFDGKLIIRSVQSPDGNVEYTGTIEDITELNKAQQELKKAHDEIIKSEKKYRNIFDISPVGICHYDKNTAITDCNEKFAEIIGAPREKIIGLNMDKELPNREVVNEIKKAFKTGTGQLEIWYTSYTGNRTAFLKTLFKTIYNDEGHINGGLFLMEDLTEKKKAEEELRNTFKKLTESEEMFRAIFYMTPNTISIHTMDGKYVDVNEAFTLSSGYTKQEVLGKTTADINGWAKPEDRTTMRTALINEGIIENFETKYRTRDGSITPVLLSAKVISLNKTPHIVTVSKNISELKRTEEALTTLKNNLEKLVETRTAELQKVTNEQKIILDNIGLGVMFLHDRKISWSNREIGRMFGYGETMIPLGTSTLACYRDEQDYREFGEKVYATLARGETSITERIFYRKDRSTFWCRLIGTAVDPDDPSKGSIWIFYDLTEHKTAEQALMASEQKMQRIFDVAPVGIGLLKDRVIVEANIQTSRITGYTQEELIGRRTDFAYSSHEEYERAGRIAYGDIQEHGMSELETVWRRKDGTLINILLAIGPLDPLDPSKGNIYSAVDITQRKKNENQLKTEKERFRALADNVPGAIYMCNNDTDFSMLYLNDIVEQITGYTKEEFLSASINFSDIYHPDDAEDVYRTVEKAIENRQQFELEYRIKHKNNEWHWIHELGTGIYENDELLYLIGFLIDVTAAKQAREEIQLAKKQAEDSEQRFRALHDASFGGIGIHDRGVILDCNQGLSEITGYSYEELIGMNGLLLIAEESRDLVKENIQQKHEKPYEAYGVCKNGKKYPLRIEARNIPYKGKQMRVVEFRDITKQKEAEEAIRKSNQKYQNLFENMVNPFTVYKMIYDANEESVDFEFIEINPAWEEYTGSPADAVIGKTIKNLYPDTENYWIKIFSTVATTGNPDSIVNYSKEFDRYLEIVVFCPEEGYCATIATDVTERKKAEEALRLTQFSIDNSTDSLFWHDEDGKIIYANQAACNSLGYTHDEMLDMYPYEFDPDFRKEDWPPLKKQLQKQKKVVFEARHRRKDGTIFPVEVSINYINYDGKFIGSAYVRDITERKQYEENLRLFKTSIDNASDSVIWMDKDACIEYVNEKCCEYTGYTHEELLKMTIMDIDPIVTKRMWDSRLKELKTDNKHKSIIFETFLKRKDGSVFPVEVTNNYMHFGEKKFVIGYSRDITERKKAEEAIRQSNEKYQSLFNNMTSGFALHEMIYDKEGNPVDYRFLEVNPAFEKLTGVSRKNIIGKTAKEVMPNIEDSWIQSHAKVAITGKPFSHIDYSADLNKYFDRYCFCPQKNRFAVVFNDVTKIKKSEAALQLAKEQAEESEQRYKMLHDASFGGIMVHKNKLIIDCNQGLTNITGYSRAELIGMDGLRLIKEEYHERVKSYIKSGARNRFEAIGLRKNGEEYPLRIDARNIAYKGGEVRCVEFRDITKEKEIEAEIVKAKDQAEAANRAKSEFLANMSHEIRTPLNAVTGFSELLSSLTMDSKQKSYIESIKTAGKSLLTLISDILDLSKIEAERIDFHYSPIDLRKILTEIKQIFSIQASRKELEFLITIDDQLPNTIILDATRIRQVLLNLVGNALKFTEKGYVKLSVKAETKSNEDRRDLSISIEDTGIGISEKDINTIFDAFKQQTGQNTRKFGGTGLGLTISRRLVEMMKGSILVESTVGKGSKFTIQIPDIEISNKEVPSIEKAVDFEPAQFERAKILVVDDIESNRIFLNETLTKMNLEVLTADNGSQAVLIAEEYQPAVILMDLRMPVMDGHEATQQLKENSKTKKIPIIAVTASTATLDESLIAGTKFDGFLPKPIETSMLISELSKYLTAARNKKKKTSSRKKHKITSHQYSQELLSEFPSILSLLETDYMSRWKEFKNKQPIDEVKGFGNDLKNLGRKKQLDFLSGYGERLIDHVENFDVEKMQLTINEFPGIIKTLKSIHKDQT